MCTTIRRAPSIFPQALCRIEVPAGASKGSLAVLHGNLAVVLNQKALSYVRDL